MYVCNNGHGVQMKMRYVCMYVCMYVCNNSHGLQMKMRYICIYVCMYVRMYVCNGNGVHMRLEPRSIYIYIYVYIYMYIHTYIHTCR